MKLNVLYLNKTDIATKEDIDNDLVYWAENSTLTAENSTLSTEVTKLLALLKQNGISEEQIESYLNK